MKFIISAAIAASILAANSAAFAQPYHRHGPPPRARYHEGQMYRGHRMHYYHGHWGYYQPRNGANVFISIPL